MNDCLFTGAATALVTPFLDGAVNYPLFEQLLRRQVDAGIEAVIVAGTTGEAPTLSDEEAMLTMLLENTRTFWPPTLITTSFTPLSLMVWAISRLMISPGMTRISPVMGSTTGSTVS